MNQAREWQTQKRRRRIPNLRRPVVHIADLSRGIQYQNNILRVIQDALVEIALALQRGPGSFLVGDVQNQPAILNRRSLRLADRRDMEERFERAAIFSSQRCLVVAKGIPFRKLLEQSPTLRRLRDEVRKQIHVEKLLLTGITEHPRKRRIRFHHPPVRIAEESPFLNTVKQLAVTPLSLQLFTYIHEDVDRLRARSLAPIHPGRGNQVAAVRKNFDRSLDSLLRIQTKRAKSGDLTTVNSQNFSDRTADEFGWMNSNPISKRPVNANDISQGVVNDDSVRNGMDSPDPLLA